MPSYLVESYVPNRGKAECRSTAARVRTATEELSRDRSSVRYVRSLFVAEDETGFHVFEATSVAVVEAVARRAGLVYARITSLTETTHDGEIRDSQSKESQPSRYQSG